PMCASDGAVPGTLCISVATHPDGNGAGGFDAAAITGGGVARHHRGERYPDSAAANRDANAGSVARGPNGAAARGDRSGSNAMRDASGDAGEALQRRFGFGCVGCYAHDDPWAIDDYAVVASGVLVGGGVRRVALRAR